MKREHLPPREVHLFNPEKNGRMPTPLDERGLVDIDALVQLAKEAVDPEYDWASMESDIHHLQWVSRRYDVVTAFLGVDGNTFRNLVNRKAYVPRVFHNWVHYITEPPPVPVEEVMQYSIDAQRVALSLARTAGLATKLTTHYRLTDAQLRQRLDEEFIHYNLFVENAREIPPEFSLLALEQIEAKTIDEMLLANKHLGQLALDKIPIIQRQVLQAA